MWRGPYEARSRAQRGQVKGGRKGICESYPFENISIREIFAQDNGDLVQSSRGPDLGIPEREAMICTPRAASRTIIEVTCSTGQVRMRSITWR